MVTSANVQCATNHVQWNGQRYVASGQSHLNSMGARSLISRKYGLRGFYRGYIPALFIYTAMKFELIRSLSEASYWNYRKSSDQKDLESIANKITKKEQSAKEELQSKKELAKEKLKDIINKFKKNN